MLDISILNNRYYGKSNSPYSSTRILLRESYTIRGNQLKTILFYLCIGPCTPVEV